MKKVLLVLGLSLGWMLCFALVAAYLS